MSKEKVDQFLINFNTKRNSLNINEFESNLKQSTSFKGVRQNKNTQIQFEQVRANSMKSQETIPDNLITPKRQQKDNASSSTKATAKNLIELFRSRNNQYQPYDERARNFSVNNDLLMRKNASLHKDFQGNLENYKFTMTTPSNRDQISERKDQTSQQKNNVVQRFKLLEQSPIKHNYVKSLINLDSKPQQYYVKADKKQMNVRLDQALSTIKIHGQNSQVKKIDQNLQLKLSLKKENFSSPMSYEPNIQARHNLTNSLKSRQTVYQQEIPNLRNFLTSQNNQVYKLTQELKTQRSNNLELESVIKTQRVKQKQIEKFHQSKLLALQAIIFQKNKDYILVCEKHQKEMNYKSEPNPTQQQSENSNLHINTSPFNDQSFQESISPRFMLFQLQEIATILNPNTNLKQYSIMSFNQSILEASISQHRKIFSTIELIKQSAIQMTIGETNKTNLHKTKPSNYKKDAYPIINVSQVDDLKNQISKLKIINKQQSNTILKMEIGSQEEEQLKNDKGTQMDEVIVNNSDADKMLNYLKQLTDQSIINQEGSNLFNIKIIQKDNIIKDLLEQNLSFKLKLQATKKHIKNKVQILQQSISFLKHDQIQLLQRLQDNSEQINLNLSDIALQFVSQYQQSQAQNIAKHNNELIQIKIQSETENFQQKQTLQKQYDQDKTINNSTIQNKQVKQIQEQRLQLEIQKNDIELRSLQNLQYVQRESLQIQQIQFLEKQISEREIQNEILVEEIKVLELNLEQEIEQNRICLKQQNIQYETIKQSTEITSMQQIMKFQEDNQATKSQLVAYVQEIKQLKLKLDQKQQSIQQIELNNFTQQSKYNELSEIMKIYETENQTLREALGQKLQEFQNFQFKTNIEIAEQSEQLNLLIEEKIQLEQKIYDLIDINPNNESPVQSAEANLPQTSILNRGDSLFDSDLSRIIIAKGFGISDKKIIQSQDQVDQNNDENEEEHNDLILKYTDLQNQNDQLLTMLEELRIELEERELNENKLVLKIKTLSNQLKERDQQIKSSDWKQNLGHTKLVLKKFIDNLFSNNRKDVETNLHLLFSLFEYGEDEKNLLLQGLKIFLDQNRQSGFLKLFK